MGFLNFKPPFKVEFDGETITRRGWFRRKTIRWDDVVKVEAWVRDTIALPVLHIGFDTANDRLVVADVDDVEFGDLEGFVIERFGLDGPWSVIMEQDLIKEGVEGYVLLWEKPSQ